MAIQVQSGTADLAVTAKPTAVALGRRILAVLDSDPGTKVVIDHLVGTLGYAPDAEIVLLNLQPRPDEIRTRAILAGKVRQHLLARGHAIAAKAEEALIEAGLSCRTRVDIGDDAMSIVRCAHENSCDLIVMATAEAGSLHRRLIKATGISICSRAGQVAEISDLPVLILKPRVQ